MTNKPDQNAPQLFMLLPKQQPLPIFLTKQQDRPESTKKTTKKVEVTENKEPLVYLEEITQELILYNPDDLSQFFITELLKLYLDDPAAKNKLPQQQQTLDLSCLLINLELKENTLLVQYNNFIVNFQLKIRIIKSTHSNQKVTSFLNAQSQIVPFVFQVVYFENIPQNPDVEYRKRFLKAVKCKVELFNQTFYSEEVGQQILGDQKYSGRVPVRVNCNFLCKSELDLQNMKKNIDEGLCRITLFSRTPVDQEYEQEKPITQDKKQRAPSGKASSNEKQQSTDFIKIIAVAKFSLKQLLYESRIEQKVQLQPKYQLIGRTNVPDTKQMFLKQQQRQPKFQLDERPPADPKELQKYNAERAKNPNLGVGNKTAFDQYQKMCDAAPIGDWKDALVKIRIGMTKPIQQLLQTQPPKQVDSKQQQRVKSGKLSQQQQQRVVEACKPEFQHFERMYIYLSANSVAQVKQLLYYIVKTNISFIKQFACEQVKQQYNEYDENEDNDNIEEFIGLLGVHTIQQVLQQQNDKQKDNKQQEVAQIANNMQYPAITGYRFVDRHVQLLYLEAPAQFDLFNKLRQLTSQLNLQTKLGPSVEFLTRLFPDSSLALNQFSLYKPLIRLSTKFDQSLVYLQPILQLFQINEENKQQPLTAPQFDLRMMKQASLFLNKLDYDSLIKYFGGNLPKEQTLQTLFVIPPQPSSPTASMDNQSVQTNTTMQTKFEKGGLSHRVKLQHKQFAENVALPEVPTSLGDIQTNVLLKVMSQTSNIKLPQLTIKLDSNLVDQVLQQQFKQKLNVYNERTVDDIVNGTNLKTDKMVRKAITGQETFMYSQQLLNKQMLQNRVESKQNARKVLKTDIHIDKPAYNKNSDEYLLMRSWGKNQIKQEKEQ